MRANYGELEKGDTEKGFRISDACCGRKSAARSGDPTLLNLGGCLTYKY